MQAWDIGEGKDPSDYNSVDCDDIENDLEDVKKDFLAQLFMDIDLKYNLRLNRKILRSFENYQNKTMDPLMKLNHKRTILQVGMEEKEDEF